MAQVESIWAAVLAKREGLSVRQIAKSVELSAARVLLNLPSPAARLSKITSG